MPEATDKREILLQNLKDAGCDKETIRQCMILAESGQIAELTRKLAAHKQRLLDVVHANQKEIDCLDFLVYSLQKKTI